MTDPIVEIYADGACKGNPGPGGWGALLTVDGRRKELFGGESATTNNRMELTAVISALESLERPCSVVLYTDSQYVQKGISEWIHAWKRKNWLRSDKKPVVNSDLWRELDQEVSRHKATWVWTKGHASHDDNNRADELATMAARERRASAGALISE